MVMVLVVLGLLHGGLIETHIISFSRLFILCSQLVAERDSNSQAMGDPQLKRQGSVAHYHQGTT